MEIKRCILPTEVIFGLMEETFASGGSYVLTVTGTSMSPTLLPGRDQVRLVSAQQHTPKHRDIVFCRREDGNYVLHRIYHLFPDGSCELNGDGQQWTETISAGNILAVVVEIQRKGRWFSCRSIPYRLYVFLWSFTRPFRDDLVRVKKCMMRSGK